jgi:hypothetical protein
VTGVRATILVACVTGLYDALMTTSSRTSPSHRMEVIRTDHDAIDTNQAVIRTDPGPSPTERQ